MMSVSMKAIVSASGQTDEDAGRHTSVERFVNPEEIELRVDRCRRRRSRPQAVGVLRRPLRPVVAFDAGGIREWLINGENGHLVPWGDTDAFARSVDHLLNRKEEEYLAIAAKDMSITAAEIANFPLAPVAPGKPLPLDYFARIEAGQLHGPDLATASPDFILETTAAGADRYVPRQFLVFFDDEHLLPSDRKRVLEGLRDFVTRLSPSDSMAILSYNVSSHVITPFIGIFGLKFPTLAFGSGGTHGLGLGDS